MNLTEARALAERLREVCCRDDYDTRVCDQSAALILALCDVAEAATELVMSPRDDRDFAGLKLAMTIDRLRELK